MIKNNKGITLITLLITIIVLFFNLFMLSSAMFSGLRVMLYNLLISDLDKIEIISEPNTHAKLLSNLHYTLKNPRKQVNSLFSIMN